MVRELRQQLTGHRVIALTLHHTDLLNGVSAAQIQREIPGQIITAVERRAKHALIQTSSKILAIQPGMTGTFALADGPPTAEQLRYAVLMAEFEGKLNLIYRDQRRFGTIRWLSHSRWATYAASLGPEPLAPQFTAEDFASRIAHSRSAIKKVIMDQKVLVGVGNIYAGEALFAAGIDPSRPASSLADTESSQLYLEIRRILQQAIECRGTSFRDYRTSTGETGGFQQQLLVYGREGQPCVRCGHRLVGTHEIDARATVFCWNCQR